MLLLASALLTGVAMGGQGRLESPAWRLLPYAQVHASGVFLQEVVDSGTNVPVQIRLTAAPAVGQSVVFTRAQINDLLRRAAPELACSNWIGATQVRVTRRLRSLGESEVKDLLTTSLQDGFVKDRGELELRLTRPWAPAMIADEPFTVAVLDLPSAGVTSSFIARFELRTPQGVLGNWQVPVQARIWREVWVAGSQLARGQSLSTADVVKERRDVLAIRDALSTFSPDDNTLEIGENLPAGAPLTLHSIRLRPVVQRGRVVEAVVKDGPLTISVKAEVLEDGVPGQTVRARNLKTKREFRGKVQNEETIVVAL
jgi:flagella basal body P-ring formation protein FlgA